MACAGSVVYKDDHLNISDATETKSSGANEIAQIYHCLMEDEIHHGEESFHILVVDERFVLIGPFVAGALGAIEALDPRPSGDSSDAPSGSHGALPLPRSRVLGPASVSGAGAEGQTDIRPRAISLLQ